MTSDGFFLFILTCLTDFSLIFYFISFIIIKKILFLLLRVKKPNYKVIKLKCNQLQGGRIELARFQSLVHY